MLMKRHLEDDLQVSVADYLRAQYPQLLWWHTPNGGRRNPREGARFKRMGVRAGVPDIIMVWRGCENHSYDYSGGMTISRHIKAGAIELKAGRNGQEDTQKLFQSQWTFSGGQYAVCRSLDEVILVLKDWGVGVERCPPAILEGAEPDHRVRPTTATVSVMEVECGK